MSKCRVIVVEHYNGTDTFVFAFSPHRLEDVLREITTLAADPTVNFTWDEAAEISNQAREFYAEIGEHVEGGLADGCL